MLSSGNIIQAGDAPKMFGVYVSNMSVSIGWGGSGGTLQMTLVEDETNGVVLEKNAAGIPFYGGGPNSPTTGTACYFKYGSFYFGGIFQRWTYKESATGGRTYDIVLESPSKLMEGVQLIIENYNGATDQWANQYTYGAPLFYAKNSYSTNIGDGVQHSTYDRGDCYNVYNLFAFWENPVYGFPYEGVLGPFGGSGFNSSGMPALAILAAMTYLMNHTPVNGWGGPMRFGSIDDASFTEYALNISNLEEFYRNVEVTSADLMEIRLQGPVKSVNGLIQELAEFHQFDYYYSIQPKNGIEQLSNGGQQIVNSSEPTIYLWIADKTKPPEPNAIRNFIQELRNKPDGQKKLMSYDLGKEFSDAVTQKFIWGGRRTRYLQYFRGNNIGGGVELSVDANTYAVWGQRVNLFGGGNVKNQPNIVGTSGQVYGSPFVTAPGAIYVPDVGLYKCKPFEIRMALEGKESWQFWKTMEVIAGSEPNGVTNLLNSPFSATQEVTKDILNLLMSGIGNSYDLICTNFARASKAWNAQLNSVGDKIFAAVSAVASNSYKQDYFVPLPSENYQTAYNIYAPAQDFIDGYYMRSWSVASSAFIKYGTDAPAIDASFFDGSSKMQACVGYPSFIGRDPMGRADLSALGSDYAIGVNRASGTIITKKGQPDGESFWYTPSNPAYGQFAVMFKTGCQPREFDRITTPDFGLTWVAQILFGITIPPERYIGSGKQSLQISIPPDVLDPVYFGIPQESQRFNYGPWVTLKSPKGNFSPNGKAEASEITQLVPETYGSYEDLAIAGSIYAQVSTAKMNENETGSIELADMPAFNIGERFATGGPYVSGMDINATPTGGVTTTYKFNTWTPEFGKLSKYNLDRIAKINKTAWARAQKLRSEIEKPPFPKFKFEKTNFDMRDKSQTSHMDASGLATLFKPNTNVNQRGIGLGNSQ